jgi:long-chain acyl-CoA synthetase
MLSLASFVVEHARVTPERVAVRLGEQTYSYGQLDALAAAVARYLVAQGLEAGDKVALSCPNLPYFPAVYYGILRAGMVAVPLNVLLKPAEIAYHLQDADAKAYFVFEGSAELPLAQAGAAAFAESPCEHLVVMTTDPSASSPVEGALTFGQVVQQHAGAFELVPRDAHDTAVILYTSGTTGKPKGAELTHLNMVMNAIVSSKLVHIGGLEGRDQVFLAALPLFHVFGQTCVMNAMFYLGAQIVLLPRFTPQGALATMREAGVTTFAGVPTMYWGLLNAVKDVSQHDFAVLKDQLKACLSGGSAMPVELLRRFEEVFEVAILEGYGLSETSPVACFNHAGRERKVGTVGQAVFGVEVRIVGDDDRELPAGEAGEIIIRGHNIMKGYYGRPEATAEALRGGWFHTGDVGVMDEARYVSVVDRLKDVIIRGGFNVYPREVEEGLMAHPEVSLAAVVGVPDEVYGEEIKAFVVLQEGSSLTPEALREWSKAHLAAYKYPRALEVVESLPMNATGKILRRELRAAAQPAPA